MATPPLAAYLLAGGHSAGGCGRRGGGGLLSRGDFCLLCDMEELALEVQGAGGKVVNPKKMLK